MTQKSKAAALILGLFTLLTCHFGTSDVLAETDKHKQHNVTINLKWNKAYEGETIERVEIGLKWFFYFMGAELKANSFQNAASWEGDIITLDFSQLGFSETALIAFENLFKQVKATGEYHKNKGIDIGRFFMLTMAAPNHYYAITGAPKELSAIRQSAKFDTVKFAIIESSISHGHRMIEIAPDSEMLHTKFIAYEGTGSIPDGTFKPHEYETIDIMPNGQFRFALYNEEGLLVPASNSAFTMAGKSAKCMWCHTLRVHSPFTQAKTTVSGYYTADDLKNATSGINEYLTQYRKNVNTGINFDASEDHTLTEILYISFMEPSVLRLSYEWNMPADSIKSILKSLPTHIHDEFPFLGELYDRRDVDSLSPYTFIKVSESAREPSQYEPDLIN